MDNNLTIFIGPKKTGTTWIHDCFLPSIGVKEVKYPVNKYLRTYVYDRYVKHSNILVWPYLLHDIRSLYALLDDCKFYDRKVTLVITNRDSDGWKHSFCRFLMKYGAKDSFAIQAANNEYDLVKANREILEKAEKIISLSIINPSSSDVSALSEIIGVDEGTIRVKLKEKVYETVERPTVPSLGLTRVFFAIKPYLPLTIQTLPQSDYMRKIFFKKIDK